MKAGLIISLALATLLVVGFFATSHVEHKNALFSLEEVNALTSFTLWTDKFNRQYSSDEEKTFRHKKYLDNQKIVKAHNARFNLGLETYEM